MDTDQRKRRMFFKISESVLLCLTLFCSVLILGQTNVLEIKATDASLFFGLGTLFLLFYEILVFLSKKPSKDIALIFNVSYIFLLFAATVFSFLTWAHNVFFWIAAVTFFTVPILKRVYSIICNHTLRNVIIKVLMGTFNVFLLFIVCFSLDIPQRDISLSGLEGIYLLIASICKIVFLTLSDINLKLLRKIIRKTYAGEIIFGLLLLIVSFSIALVMLEENIRSFGDALWYCFAIVTTIGFGDVTATTVLGRILSVILGMYGMIVVAILTSIIVNFYNEVKSLSDVKPANTESTVSVLSGGGDEKTETENNAEKNSNNDNEKKVENESDHPFE